MPPPFERHVFVCTNRRPDGHPKGCCATKGGEEVRAAFKEELDKRGLKRSMRANAAGCVDTCAFGVSVVVYPEGIWYGGVKVEDVPTIVEEHLVQGRPVERLLMPFNKKAER
ncbi:(2Fe-2S) ferredoxin domain-containing protein [Corallococcus coralloides]|uniref:(2Fe-2S) ferredoxin domain-containing protein n=1 Tax=Corallococcus coralloides TaxID=184914 RepID=UPI003850C271